MNRSSQRRMKSNRRETAEFAGVDFGPEQPAPIKSQQPAGDLTVGNVIKSATRKKLEA